MSSALALRNVQVKPTHIVRVNIPIDSNVLIFGSVLIRDLALRTDFRDVFGEIGQKHLGARNLKAVFPGYDASSSKFRGFLG